jgi:hypothetical protein
MTTRFSVEALRARGFSGFISVAELRASGCRQVPSQPGVYLALRVLEDDPAWLDANPGGRFKQRNPTVPITTLAANWVAGTPVLYIGKADNLQERLRKYINFGAGRPVAHWGGRLTWQVSGSEDFLIAWRSVPEPLAREAELIEEFVVEFQAMPFANLRR